MNLLDYKKAVNSTALGTNKIPEGAHTNLVELLYCAGKLAGECGEVSEHICKALRDDQGQFTPTRLAKIEKELGDVVWYWTRICALLYIDPNMVLVKNVEKVVGRKERGTTKGDGDDR